MPARAPIRTGMFSPPAWGWSVGEIARLKIMEVLPTRVGITLLALMAFLAGCAAWSYPSSEKTISLALG